MNRPVRIAVCGGSAPDERDIELAERIGTLLAQAGAVVICGGRGGCMEAAARGAQTHGGVTVGVLPGQGDDDANGYITLPLPTGMGEMRDTLVVSFSEAVIAIGGEWGTLTEVSYAMKIGRPVVLLEPTLARDLPCETAESPEQAVRRVLELTRQRRSA